MEVLVVSSSLGPDSRSRRLARLCEGALRREGVETHFADLSEHRLPGFDDDAVYDGDRLRHDKLGRLEKTMRVTAVLCRLLGGRTYASTWEV